MLLNPVVYLGQREEDDTVLVYTENQQHMQWYFPDFQRVSHYNLCGAAGSLAVIRIFSLRSGSDLHVPQLRLAVPV